MPLFRLNEYAQPQFVSSDSRECRNAAKMRDTVARGLLQPSAYHRRPIQSGDMLLFPQSTPHFGTRNNSFIQRIALFSVLTPFSSVEQDAFQLFCWMYVEAAAFVRSNWLASSTPIVNIIRSDDSMRRMSRESHCQLGATISSVSCDETASGSPTRRRGNLSGGRRISTGPIK